MDVKFVNPFVQAIGNVFRTMVQTEVTIGRPHMKADPAAPTDVTGIIGLSGDVTGSVVLSFQLESAVAIASKFAGTDVEPDHPDFADALGELANMVAGNAKKDFHGYEVNISLPSVIIGQGHKVSASHVAPQLVIPCDCPLGSFAVEVSVETDKQRSVTPSMASAEAGAGQ